MRTLGGGAGEGRKGNPPGDLRPELLPRNGPRSVNLIGTVNRGTLAAEAEIVHRGRTTVVVDVRVFDALGGRAGR